MLFFSVRNILALVLVCAASDVFKIQCDAICKHDGDVKGIVIGSQCGCWNPININQVVLKVQVAKQEKKKLTYSEAFGL